MASVSPLVFLVIVFTGWFFLLSILFGVRVYNELKDQHSISQSFDDVIRKNSIQEN